MKKILLMLAFSIALGCSNIPTSQNSHTSPQEVSYLNQQFQILEIEDLSKLKLLWKDDNNQSLKTFDNLQSYLEKQGKILVFATNGGIFDPELNPLGLYRESNNTLNPINRENGSGNFFLKPNGIWMFSKNSSTIINSEHFSTEGEGFRYALQSGPLLVEKNQIHDAFSSESPNRYIRSGVGISNNGKTILAISQEQVTLYEFAQFFKEQLNCPNALYLDGAISQFYTPQAPSASNNQTYSTFIALLE